MKKTIITLLLMLLTFFAGTPSSQNIETPVATYSEDGVANSRAFLSKVNELDKIIHEKSKKDSATCVSCSNIE